MTTTADVVVVGAGILGLAHAFHLARSGARVVVVERHARARGASVRNFGMIWPIGQPFGPRRRVAERSRSIWEEVAHAADIPTRPVGSLHVAMTATEARVLEEFRDRAAAEGLALELLDGAEAGARAPGLRRDRVRAGLFSRSELQLDPRTALRALPAHLERAHGVVFHHDTLARGHASGRLETSRGVLRAPRLVVCSGDELQQLFPAHLATLPLRRCKLQMLRTRTQPAPFRLGPMLAAGPTLAHYAAFRVCPGREALVQELEAHHPRLRARGIHVMAAENPDGEIVIGDSHEWEDADGPFDAAEIEEDILHYLSTFLRLPDPRVASRWHGRYVAHAEEMASITRPEPGVTVVTGLGGAGMTLSFGIAEAVAAEVLTGPAREPA